MATDDDDRLSFYDFPEDVQLAILSFLTPSQLSAFSCTSKRSYSLYASPDSPLWSSLCRRKFGSLTRLDGWGRGRIPYRHLYSALSDIDSLTGFWRPCVDRQTDRHGDADGDGEVPSLLLVEWGASFLLGSRVYPSREGSYNVVKSPFLWMFLSEKGQRVSFIDPKERGLDPEKAFADLVDGDSELVAVNVSSLGCKHLLVEDSDEPGWRSDGISSSGSSSAGSFVGDEVEEGSGDDVPEAMNGVTDLYMKEMYQHFANRMSPGSRGLWKRQRRRERERKKKRFEELHFVRVVNCSPIVSRPFQGLWKGIDRNLKLGFYLVTYDDSGRIACQKVGESDSSSPGFAPVLWISTPNSQKSASNPQNHPPVENEVVCRIFSVNTRGDSALPNLDGPAFAHFPITEGRIWQYGDGTLGFGFLTDSLIIDLKHVTLNGCLLDVVTHSSD